MTNYLATLMLFIQLCINLEQKPPPSSIEIVRITSLLLELSDMGTDKGYFRNKHEFEADWGSLIRRNKDFGATPHLSEYEWLPSEEFIQQCLNMNAFYKDFSCARRDLYKFQDSRWELYQAWNQRYMENGRLFNIWDAVRDIRKPYYYVGYRRKCGVKLFELIGMERWCAKILPFPIPLEPDED